MGWKMTKVMKKSDTASLTALAFAPISWANPETYSQHRAFNGGTSWEHFERTLCLSISHVTAIKSIEEVEKGQEGKDKEVKLPVHGAAKSPLLSSLGEIAVWDVSLMHR